MHIERNIGESRIKIVICDRCEAESDQDDIVVRQSILELKSQNWGAKVILEFDLHNRCAVVVRSKFRSSIGIGDRSNLLETAKDLMANRIGNKVSDQELYINGN